MLEYSSGGKLLLLLKKDKNFNSKSGTMERCTSTILGEIGAKRKGKISFRIFIYAAHYTAV